MSYTNNEACIISVIITKIRTHMMFNSPNTMFMQIGQFYQRPINLLAIDNTESGSKQAIRQIKCGFERLMEMS